ncbi:hypothetical protein PV08_02080 [Exophiala spinifera]|uniref:Condensation domain-containing protein n=1 Tax=Exophiala spinifera TaxID=91928 RepID=A0A0D2BSX8_9EURO|nr:uncharacterized protein PV08_02080 [Exophiala spinifera]KIW21500.1 hypothetical protein PV08_02080 [Exophiala spinifera]
MAWTESSPGPPAGHFKRPLNLAEKGLISVIEAFRPSPRELIRINAFADFTIASPSGLHVTRDDVISAFRTAWKALRLLKSPDIATTVEDAYKVYQVPSAVEVDAWLERTFIASASTSTTPETAVQSAVREMQQRLELLPVCQLISRPLDDDDTTGTTLFKGTVILFISHWRTEASGAFKILDHLFSFVADLLASPPGGKELSTTAARLSSYRPGDECSLLTPAIEDILMPGEEDVKTTPEAKARVAAHFDKYYSSLPSVDFPMSPSSHHGEGDGESTALAPFGSVKEIRHVYSVSALDKLYASCKSYGISITAAVHSAYIGAMYTAGSSRATKNRQPGDENDSAKRGRDECDQRLKRNYACLMPAEVRTRLPKSSPYRDQGCWSSAMMLMLVVPSAQEQDFVARARDLKSQYRLADQKEWMYADARETSEQVSMLGSRTPPDGQSVSMGYFTGVGVLDRETIKSTRYGGGEDDGSQQQIEVSISDVDFFADPLSPGIVLRVWTFRSRLNIHVVWNSAYHDNEQIREVMRSVDETLTKEMGVDMLNERVVVEEKEF